MQLLIKCKCGREEKKNDMYYYYIKTVIERSYHCLCGNIMQINIAYLKKNCIIDSRAKLE